MTGCMAIIGFGEAGAAFAGAADWRGTACAYDLSPARRAAMGEAGVKSCDNAVDALANAQLILSLVTADQALQAAIDYAPLIAPGAIWCDMNSVAPDTKRAAAKAIEAAGGRYVDVAVLSPVDPARLAAPLLVSGLSAADAAQNLRDIGFTNVREAGEEIGRASAIKLCRSIMVKGIEALSDEMMAAAAAAGVTDDVLASLDASDKPMRWADRAAYNLERMATHGLRRAAEMDEAAKMLQQLGVDPAMTRGTVQRQREAATNNKTARNAA
ncbi:NAD(P)-dependent oxidoreductase [Aurantiacibacter poecillastricola]|uniref:NAD(P)-dependent oxidoreductase n=1 Tax=Aurantiacibacter poecillastricola TaxID=3064385 RepID=UPI00273F99E7|nr:NAD(P)-dependent oxidoreductase [Aurantiacibacter sp. 219JJ12-13]MDP5263584.1 DUF1932 domain-containing protein [Aurantiacibacter sp. 219JJ12-13]